MQKICHASRGNSNGSCMINSPHSHQVGSIGTLSVLLENNRHSPLRCTGPRSFYWMSDKEGLKQDCCFPDVSIGTSGTQRKNCPQKLGGFTMKMLTYRSLVLLPCTACEIKCHLWFQDKDKNPSAGFCFLNSPVSHGPYCVSSNFQFLLDSFSASWLVTEIVLCNESSSEVRVRNLESYSWLCCWVILGNSGSLRASVSPSLK